MPLISYFDQVALVLSYSNDRVSAPTPDELAKLLADCQKSREERAIQTPTPRPLARRLNKDDIAALAEMYEAGATTTQVRSAFGLSQGALLKLLNQNSVAIRRQGLSPEQIQQATQLYESGLAVMPIANQLGSNYTTVRLALIRAGVSMRSRLDWTGKVNP